MGLAMRVEKTPQYPYAITLGALAPLSQSFGFMKLKTNRIRFKISWTSL
jgi:hypothetical protein